MNTSPSCLVGALPTPEVLETVVLALKEKGFSAAQFGVLVASPEGPESFAQLAAEPESEKTFEAAIAGGLFYVGAVTAAGAAIFAGGGLAAILLAVAAGGGASGVLGLLAAAGFHQTHAAAVGRHLDNGRVLLWITPETPGQWLDANAVLLDVAAIEVMTNGAPPTLPELSAS